MIVSSGPLLEGVLPMGTMGHSGGHPAQPGHLSPSGSPSRIGKTLTALSIAFRERRSRQEERMGQLRGELERTEGRERDRLASVLAEEESVWRRVGDANNQLTRLYKQHYNAYKGMSRSLSDLRGSASSSRPSKMNDIEKELSDIMGKIVIEIKAVCGFARLSTGDVFEVSIRCANYKWKTRGKTMPDRTQKWEKEECSFHCYVGATIDIKVRMVKSKVLCERSFDLCEVFLPEPQLLTLDLNSSGSIKLQLVMTWHPFKNTFPTNTLSSDSGRTRVLLREKKRGSAARIAATKGGWRSSTCLLDDIYSDLSRRITAPEGASSSLSSSSMASRRSASLAYLSSPHEKVAIRRKPSIHGMSSLLHEVTSFVSKMAMRMDEMRDIEGCLLHLASILDSKKENGELMAGSNSEASDDLDDNILIGDHISEDDSGFHSLTQHRYNRKNELKDKNWIRHRRKSIGVLEVECEGANEEAETALEYHLKRLWKGVQMLASLPSGPLVFRSSELLRMIELEGSNLSDVGNILSFGGHPINLSNLLSELGADADVHEMWLSAAFPLSASLVVPFDAIRSVLLQHVSSIAEIVYPHLVVRVTDNVIDLLRDEIHTNSPHLSVFHFVSLFRGNPFVPFIESLTHETWMVSLVSAHIPSMLDEVLFHLSSFSSTPSLPVLRQLAIVLSLNKPDLRDSVEVFLRSSEGSIRVAFVSSFLCLLEDSFESVRLGALEALGILRNERILRQLAAVRDNDPSDKVRTSANLLFKSIEESTIMTRI